MILAFDNVSYSYHSKTGETPVLEDMSFSIDNNEILGIVGPSGCGKSTILSLVSKLIYPSSGKVVFENENFSYGYMLQKDELFPWRNVLSNIMLGREIKKDKNKDIIIEYLKKYKLYDFIKSYPNELSGGMRQRVALIRTLVLNPTLLLLDEPFSALDFQTRLELVEDIFNMIKQEQKSAIFVTHDIQEAISLSDRILVLSKRPAKIKLELKIKENNLSPFKRRNLAQFNDYFNLIYESIKSEKQNE